MATRIGSARAAAAAGILGAVCRVLAVNAQGGGSVTETVVSRENLRPAVDLAAPALTGKAVFALG
jgi:hypothetical protein